MAVTARWAARQAGRTAGIGRVKVVRFAGYAINVPAAWPVYRLDLDPARCVRYDRHAVYLGWPGASQQCPAHLAGRVATLTLEPGGQPASVPADGTWLPVDPGWLGRGGGDRWYPGRAAALVRHDPWNRQLWAAFDGGLTITATYGAEIGLVKTILHTVRWIGAAPWTAAVRGAAPAGPAASVWHAAQPSARGGLLAKRAGHHNGEQGRDRGCHHRCCHHHRRCHRYRRFHMPVKGFDTCAAPALHTMRAWRRAFSAAAIYLGGPEAACGWGNMSAAWVRAAVRMGWALLPAYVGPQAPCTTFSVRIHPGYAEAEGRAAAREAIRLASALGLGPGAPLYDDMEAYNDRQGRCRHPVLAFLDGWTRELHARGYESGVYSSAAAAAHDLGNTTTVYGHRLARPDSLWFALWDKRQNIQGWPYLLKSWWGGRHRIKQYMGAHRRRINGVRMSIDSDQVCGAIYRPRRRFVGC